jgi:cystathionine beta-lyase family protein involved in aluminum resistance
MEGAIGLETKIAEYFEKELSIPTRITNFVWNNHKDIKKSFEQVDALSEYHQGRILQYMGECRISERHFNPSTGYGYSDDGRDTLDKLYALVFGSQDALVRPQWASGTHVISDCLFALVKPEDTILSITGKPYDTLEQVIGVGHKSVSGSLRDWGVFYEQIDLTPEGNIDIPKILTYLEKKKVKLAFIQRSRGYSWRPALSIREIGNIIYKIKEKQPEITVLVDNCYGEFTEELEPSHVGADLVVGSLIKNPGGGLAPTGAYAVGTHEAIERVSYRLTSPGLGREVGSYASSYLPFYQGLFLSPHVVGEAIKGAILAAKIFQSLGYKVQPQWNEPRSDIIQSIEFPSAEELITFCQAIQSMSPVDSHVTPFPWDMPGYNHQVIMAAGTFVQGASIELSADAPILEPYIAYLQGGLTYHHVKIALMKVLSQMSRKGYLNF